MSELLHPFIANSSCEIDTIWKLLLDQEKVTVIVEFHSENLHYCRI